MAATRRKPRKKKATTPTPPAKAGLLTTLGTRIKTLATGLVSRRKKRKAATKKAATKKAAAKTGAKRKRKSK